MKGFKVFNSDWTCRGYQFEVGKTFEENVEPKCCDRGFHFCIKASDCFNYYEFNSNNKVAEVEALGVIDTESDDTKCCTNKIHIIRELTWHEVLDLVNTGKDCTGFCNSGHYNSGHYNSGNRNSGDWNSGDWNSGHCNSGHYNSGHYNSGDWNSGHCNSGHYNSGDWNSGHYNSGHYNSGHYNSGNRNSGHYNSGHYNSGNRNSGDWNSGDWNKSSNTVGCFNTQNQKLMFFDKPTDMTLEQWWSSDACRLMDRIDFTPVVWVWSDDMTDKEKSNYPEHETTGGYLKIRDNSDYCKEWWKGLTKKEKNIIKSIPNFDAEKFYEITGVIVD